MKKCLVWILLLITVAGTFVPCCSVDDCCAYQVAGASHNEHNDKGSCSPFFACATCSGFVETAKTIQLEFPTAEGLIHHGETIKFTLPSYSSSFWQPPRSC